MGSSLVIGPSIISTPPLSHPVAEDPDTPVFDEADEPAAEFEQRVCPIGVEQHGARLDHALVTLVPELSRNYLQQLVEGGAVLVNGQLARKPSAKVRAGDSLVISLRPTLQSQAFRPEPMVLQTVYEDAHLRVIDKPAGLVVHPAPGNWSGTLLNGLLALDPQAAVLPRAGIVHRLDKDTSGLMVVARSRAAMDALVRQIAAREVHRQYLALAHKPWHGAALRHVDAAVGRDPRQRLRMAVVDLGRDAGKPAETDFELLANADTHCLLRCTLHTGRTHQIRVHAASIGHPLLADTLYGGSPALGLTRQALHAQRLSFAHPVTQKSVSLESALPPDLSAALVQGGLRYN